MRQIAIGKGVSDTAKILPLCERLCDSILVPLGVTLDESGVSQSAIIYTLRMPFRVFCWNLTGCAVWYK